MLLAAFFACAADSPPAPTPAPVPAEPVATVPGEVGTPAPAEPTPETRAAATALHDDAVAVDAAFAAELARRSTLKSSKRPCPAALDATRAATWVTADAPAVPPGVRAAAELLHAVDPAAFAAPLAVADAPAPNATVGMAVGDFDRVRAELASPQVFYWESKGTPPVIDESAKVAPGERVFSGGSSSGDAWVWDGAARRLVCRADVTVENTAPIVTKETQKAGWDIGLAVAVAASKSALALD